MSMVIVIVNQNASYLTCLTLKERLLHVRSHSSSRRQASTQTALKTIKLLAN